MLSNSTSSLVGVLVVGVASYGGLLIILRLSGKRTLSALNAFDFVVTVAMGSTLATTILSPDVALAGGIAAFAVLVVMQLVVTFFSVRFKGFSEAIKGTPTRLVNDGNMLPERMKKQRITEDEILQAARSAGRSSLDGVDIVLETNGKLSVVPASDGVADAMSNVR